MRAALDEMSDYVKVRARAYAHALARTHARTHEHARARARAITRARALQSLLPPPPPPHTHAYSDEGRQGMPVPGPLDHGMSRLGGTYGNAAHDKAYHAPAPPQRTSAHLHRNVWLFV